jgi:hypothetical protein
MCKKGKGETCHTGRKRSEETKALRVIRYTNMIIMMDTKMDTPSRCVLFSQGVETLSSENTPIVGDLFYAHRRIRIDILMQFKLLHPGAWDRTQGVKISD